MCSTSGSKASCSSAHFLPPLGRSNSGSPLGGLALACLGGLLLGALHGWFAIVQRADQIVSGIAIVILGLGLSSFLFRLTMGTAPSVLPAFRALDLGALSTLPLIGPVLFGQNLLAYLTVLFAIILWFVLSRTPLGLAIRACGENPEAAEAAGIKVNTIRFGCVLFSGAMAGIGGAYLAIAQINSFVENMVVGRGFIAIACVVFGRWHPLGALAAALGFGITEAAQIRLQTCICKRPINSCHAAVPARHRRARVHGAQRGAAARARSRLRQRPDAVTPGPKCAVVNGDELRVSDLMLAFAACSNEQPKRSFRRARCVLEPACSRWPVELSGISQQ